jgi:murein DD-endopeptidase MepM/ murein hydrolase activator NlpD
VIRALLLLAAATCHAQTWKVEPEAPRQGDTIRLSAGAGAASARMGDRQVRLFTEADGTRFGLMPVGALLEAGSRTIEFLDTAGRVLHTATVNIRDARFPKQNIQAGKAVLELKPAPGELETMRALRTTVSDVRRWEEPFVTPVPGCMTSPYGVTRLHNGKPTGNYHGGVDQRAPAGEPIHATTSGTVKVARMFNVHGGTVGIDHGQGVTSAYLHMSRIAATEGAAVKKGDVIGYVGATGRATGPHLHWTIAVNGVPVNPRQWVELAPCAARAILRSNGRNPRR